MSLIDGGFDTQGQKSIPRYCTFPARIEHTGSAPIIVGPFRSAEAIEIRLRDPEILILDEATSHVDNETEVLIQQSLEKLTEDRTTFSIAHRLSTVRDADHILVLEDGEIVERGTHGELLEHDGLYANLWRVQVGEVGSLLDRFIEEAAARDRA